MSEAKHISDAIDAAMLGVQGRLSRDVDLSKQTWFRVGGTADAVFKPQNMDDLTLFLSQLDDSVPVFPLGVASNIIIRDGGLRGVTVRLVKGFTDISQIDETTIEVGAGATDRMTAISAAKFGIAGLSFFSGIPGSFGGAVKMNAGCYGRETCDALIDVTCVDRHGFVRTIPAKELNMRYRHTDLPEGWIVTSGRLRGTIGDTVAIEAEMEDIRQKREDSQPIREKTGGSTFANPVDENGEKLSAWKVIDEAGCRGLRFGGAHMSEKHCNFMINDEGATALDIEQLGETVRQRVFDHSGIMLRWEIRRIGEFLPGDKVDYARF